VKAQKPAFPFSAVVGQEDLQLALLLAAVDPAIGGVLVRGQKGSGKTTLARGLAALLPGMAPFIELPVGASEERLVGSVDLRLVITEGEHRFLPGLLAAADGGVLYVDEVNLLPDHLVDVLLDVAVSGVNRVERDGVSHQHPSRFVLLGSMNPEEGELRPQLLDRFGFSVDVLASEIPGERAEAIRRRLAFDADPEGFCASWSAPQEALRARVVGTRPARLGEGLLDAISALCVAAGVEGLRADLVTARATAALAGWEGRDVAAEEDVRRVAPLVLAHRRRRTPFESPGIAAEELDEMLDEAFRAPAWRAPHGDAGDEPPGAAGGQDGADGQGGSRAGRSAPPVEPRAMQVDLPVPGKAAEGLRPGGAEGRRGSTGEAGRRGRHVGDRVPEGPVGALAVTGTLLAAASRAGSVSSSGPLVVSAEDIREKVHEHRESFLVILVVDASGSMAQERMAAAKGAALSLLLDAYQHRDQVAVVTFAGEGAEVLLRPTSSVDVARSRLVTLPTGGRTPLAAGITTAAHLASSPGVAQRTPVVVLVSDGRATAAEGGQDPVAAALAAATLLRAKRVPAVVIDVEDGPIRLGLAAGLAEEMGARYIPVEELTGDRLAHVVRSALPVR
jgi:magnesium chelatase subunit D